MAGAQTGLRERKKQRTREQIAETAFRLFIERGFDDVTVVEIARAADVAEGTVYNYFPAKEDLVYSRMESFEDRMLEAIGEREPGTSALAAFGEFLRGSYRALTKRAASGELKTITAMITSSPTLLAREQQVFAQYTQVLARLLAEETRARDDDVRALVAANALLGLHRAIIDYVRQRVLAGAHGSELSRDVDRLTRQGLSTLERGLGDYAIKRSRRLR